MGKQKFRTSFNEPGIGSKYSWFWLVAAAVFGFAASTPKSTPSPSEATGTEMKSSANEEKKKAEERKENPATTEPPEKETGEKANSTGTNVSKPDSPTTPPTATAPLPPTAAPSGESLIREYYGAIQIKDTSKISNCLGEFVDYYDQGKIQRSKAIEDIEGDWKRYTNTDYQLSNIRQITDETWGFVLEYKLMQGDQPRSGQLQMTLVLSKESPSKIVSLKAKVIRAH